jgi:uncharacterized DUF497 family protein
MSRFDWDREKARVNLRKHGVSFEEAATVDADPYRRAWVDTSHERDDDRLGVIGYSRSGLLLVVITSERGPWPRIISARRATKRERREHEARS